MIQDLKDLEKFFKLCRKQGVVKADLSSLTFEFGDLPTTKTSGDESEPSQSLENFPDGELTPEQLIYYSSGGSPENDPMLKGT